MSHPLCYTLRMIMNDTKTYKATYTNENPHEYPNGKVTLEGSSARYHIMNWHSFDDIGVSLDTVQVWNPHTHQLFEIYSSDEGETFTFSAPEA